jgi:mono/diheme cytochrome c family protein
VTRIPHIGVVTRTALLALVVACTSRATADPTPASGSGAAGSGSATRAPPSERFEHDMMVRFHMHENFGVVRAIERLLLRGKLEEARDLARAISIAPDEPGLGTWSEQAIRVRDQASVLATAKTVDDACAAEAKLASECAGCHVATGAMPEFGSPPRPPPDRPTVDARMARHLWASDRLWEGMVGMADDSWRAGLDVLAATPLPASELGAEREVLARKLQRLADRGRKAKADQERATLYGDMLATCAACHTTRRAPPSAP